MHHVLAFIVDPQARATGGHDQRADHAGAARRTRPIARAGPASAAPATAWTCRACPWPGRPARAIVEYPAGMGVPIKTTDKLVVQIHYNLADPASAGKTDSTTVHLRFADSVSRELAFLLPDRSCSTRSATRRPTRCRPGRPTPRTRGCCAGATSGSPASPSVDLMAVMPHMHRRGIRQTMKHRRAGNLACASHLESWDFHWQEFYFYKTPIAITPDDAGRRSPASTTPAPTPRPSSPAGARATRCASPC